MDKMIDYWSMEVELIGSSEGTLYYSFANKQQTITGQLIAAAIGSAH